MTGSGKTWIHIFLASNPMLFLLHNMNCPQEDCKTFHGTQIFRSPRNTNLQKSNISWTLALRYFWNQLVSAHVSSKSSYHSKTNWSHRRVIRGNKNCSAWSALGSRPWLKAPALGTAENLDISHRAPRSYIPSMGLLLMGSPPPHHHCISNLYHSYLPLGHDHLEVGSLYQALVPGS